jgi:hypothetical protein
MLQQNSETQLTAHLSRPTLRRRYRYSSLSYRSGRNCKGEDERTMR